MCTHKQRLTMDDKRFLRRQRIKPYDCYICEQVRDLLIKPDTKPSHEDDEARSE